MNFPSRLSPSGVFTPPSVELFDLSESFQLSSAAPGAAVVQPLTLMSAPNPLLPIVGGILEPAENGLYIVTLNGKFSTSSESASFQLAVSSGNLATWSQQSGEDHQVSWQWIGNLGPDYEEQLKVTATSASSPPTYTDVRLQVTRIYKVAAP